jgi:DNA gyrase subunit A
MQHVKGPDFPTGGSSSAGRASAMRIARAAAGSSCARGAHIEELRGGKSAIIVTELPYGVKKGGDSGVIKKIADLVNDKVLTEISDLADHSDRSACASRSSSSATRSRRSR